MTCGSHRARHVPMFYSELLAHLMQQLRLRLQRQSRPDGTHRQRMTACDRLWFPIRTAIKHRNAMNVNLSPYSLGLCIQGFFLGKDNCASQEKCSAECALAAAAAAAAAASRSFSNPKLRPKLRLPSSKPISISLRPVQQQKDVAQDVY